MTAAAATNWLRVFLAGGLTSYRALFSWLNPWIFGPMLVAYPLFQMLFFVYLGRSAGTADDTFFLIGNSFVAAAITCLFGMGSAIGGERRFQTLPVILASPASRLALFLGRAVPTIANGFVAAALTFGLGALILGVSLPASTLAGLAVALLASSLACAGLGLCVGSLSFRTRSIAVFADTLSALMLVVTGANVPVSRLPELVNDVAAFVPLTHGLHAARDLAAGGSLVDNLTPIGLETLVGLGYLAAGMAMLRYFERDARRAGSLETV